MKFYRYLFISFVLLPIGLHAKDSVYFQKDGLFLGGIDPVSYTQKTGPQKGTEAWSSQLGDGKVLFLNASNKGSFDKNPSQWIPAYNGYCAYAMADDELFKVNPKNFKIINGKVHLFYENFFSDTLKKWNVNESEFKKRADRNWKKRVQ